MQRLGSYLIFKICLNQYSTLDYQIDHTVNIIALAISTDNHK